jgi:adenine-specific DNA-methyltransferase
MIFDDVSIQTMIMIFQKNQSEDNYMFDYRKVTKQNKDQNQIYDIMNGISNEGIETFQPNFNRENHYDKTFTFNNEENDQLLTKIIKSSNFTLNKNEIVQGIVPNPDYVNSRNIKNFTKDVLSERGIKLGDGVFILEKNHFKDLSNVEKKYLKPVIEPTDIDRFYIGESSLDVIYINKSNYKSDCPTLTSHLEKYREIMSERRENQNGRLDYYHLHWSRDENFFKDSPKILSVRKCKYPTFVYTEESTYVMMSMNVIKSDRINLKYLSGVLNSNVISYYFKRKGKLQGENYQIDSEPLLETPIMLVENKFKEELINIVDLITEKRKNNEDISNLYSDLNQIVYKIYNLENNDIITIENTIKN